MSSPIPVHRRVNNFFHLASGVTVSAVGLFALYGWHSNSNVLTTIGPKLPPMHYVSAILFVLSGVSIALTGLKKKTASVIFSAIVLLVAIGDQILRFSGLSIPGLEIAGPSYFHVTTIGAAVFLLTALALLIGAGIRRHGPVVRGSSGAFALACGLATLIVIITGFTSTLAPVSSPELSVGCAIAFTIMGSSIVMGSRSIHGELWLNWKHYVPVAILIAGLTFSFLARQHMRGREQASLEQTISTELSNLRHQIESGVVRRIVANERMAGRWAEEGGTRRDLWEKDANRLFRDFGGFHALAWVDKDYSAKWVASAIRGKNDTGIELPFDSVRRGELTRARDQRKTMVSAPIEAPNGEAEILTYTPIFRDRHFFGFIAAVYDAEYFLGEMIPDSARSGYSFAFSQNGREFHTIGEPGRNTLSVAGQSDFLDLSGTTYSISIKPNSEKVAQLGTNGDDIVFWFGTLISILIAGSVLLAQRARRHSFSTAKSNELLKTEIESRKRIEKVLRETSTFRKAILNGANCMIISTDRNGLITSYNLTAEYLMGYTAAEVIGKFTLDHFHLNEEIEDYNFELARRYGFQLEPGFESIIIRAKDRIADEREWTYTCKNGSTFPVALSVTAIEDENGHITGYLAIGRDNSQLHNTSKQLKESEERFKAVVNNTPALVYIKDKDGRFVFSNNKFEALLDLEPGELIGKTVFELTDRETAERVWETESRVLESGIPEESSELVLHGDQPLAHYLFVRFIIPSITRKKYLGVIAIDLSPQLAVEEELRTANRAAIESSRLKSEFLANMSHEIRTPMNGVLGMLEVLLDTSLNTSQREYAEVIQESAKSLLTILDDILDFSKLEAGKLAFETIEFDLRSTVEITLALFAEAAESKGIEIASMIDPDVPTSLRGDPGRFRQVLTNLIGNAVKFTDQGFVTLNVSQVGGDQDRVTLRIEIKDTGIGITPDAQKQLFEAFVQADGSLIRKYGGTGLGLSISKQLVELMNGEIGVVSEPGNGSTFAFTVEFEVQKESEEFEPALNLHGVRALICDDLEISRKNIACQLEELGMVTAEAASGEDCLEVLVSHAESKTPFDIVIIEAELPGLNGFETAELIKGKPEISETKIVIMPSHNRRNNPYKVVRSGIAAYLAKPVRRAELLDCVKKLLLEPSRDETVENDPKVERLITRHPLNGKKAGADTLILLATSDPAKREALVMQLELLGYRSELAENGYEALEAVKSRNYALMLLDLQLETLDGFKTANQIRTHLLENDMPIIALANTFSRKEKKHAFESGMDDYLALPSSEKIFTKVLADNLNREMRKARPTKLNGISEEVPGGSKSGDGQMEEFIRSLATDFGHDMSEMTMSLFAEDAYRHMSEIKYCASQKGFERLEALSDSLLLVCETIAAVEMQGPCRELKIAASEKAGVIEAVASLEKVFDSTLTRLENLSKQTEKV